MQPHEVHAKVGENCKDYITRLVQVDPACLYDINLPAALTNYYSHQGFSSDATKRFLDSETANNDEEDESEEYIEMEEERGIGYWKKIIRRFEKDEKVICQTGATREKLLEEARKQLKETGTRLRHAKDML